MISVSRGVQARQVRVVQCRECEVSRHIYDHALDMSAICPMPAKGDDLAMSGMLRLFTNGDFKEDELVARELCGERTQVCTYAVT